MRKFREGFKEGFDGSSPQAAQANLKQAVNDAVNDCTEECPTNKKDCPDKSECDKGKDGKECRDDVAKCGKGIKGCQKACKAPKFGKLRRFVYYKKYNI